MTAFGHAQIVDDHEVILDTAVRQPVNPIHDFDKAPDEDVEPRFLADLPHNRSFQGLASLNGATRQTPFTLKRRMAAPHEENAAGVEDDRANTEHRPLRKGARHSPITLTTTRFLRWPSNSA